MQDTTTTTAIANTATNAQKINIALIEKTDTAPNGLITADDFQIRKKRTQLVNKMVKAVCVKETPVSVAVNRAVYGDVVVAELLRKIIIAEEKGKVWVERDAKSATFTVREAVPDFEKTEQTFFSF